jgi:hypothetical protein
MKMLHFLPVTFFLFLMLKNALFAQDHPYQYIEQAFDEEFNEEETTDEQNTPQNRFIYAQPYQMPAWVFDATDSGQQIMLGVSDPGLDSLTGLYQAQLRAIALYSLTINASLGNLSELFGKDDVVKLKSVHESLVASKSSIAFPHFCLLNQGRSTFDETFVVLKFDQQESCKKQLKDSLICLLDIYTQEFEHGDWQDLNKNFTMQLFDIRGNCQMNYFTVENSRKQFTIESKLEDIDLVSPSYPFVYQLPGNSQSFLSGGFWRHYLIAYINGLKAATELQVSTVKSHDERKNEQFQHDINSISNKTMGISINKLEILPEEIHIEILMNE